MFGFRYAAGVCERKTNDIIANNNF